MDWYDPNKLTRQTNIRDEAQPRIYCRQALQHPNNPNEGTHDTVGIQANGHQMGDALMSLLP